MVALVPVCFQCDIPKMQYGAYRRLEISKRYTKLLKLVERHTKYNRHSVELYDYTRIEWETNTIEHPDRPDTFAVGMTMDQWQTFNSHYPNTYIDVPKPAGDYVTCTIRKIS